MELVYMVQEVLQNGAEHAASYRVGQNVLRQLDRALLTVEKCARWAVPPPLDQDERPHQELVRPLPWIFFLALLIMLRVIRESLSLVNLVLGKPPVRSADMVTYIQGKRRYVRTLKYQGGRAMRARGTRGGASTYSSLRTLLDFAMCFRRPQHNHPGSNDEVMIVKCKPANEAGEGATCATETTMERLIEKMIVNLDDESDDSRSCTSTNVTSVRSDKLDYTDSEHETANENSKPGPVEESGKFSEKNNVKTSTENHADDADTKELSDSNLVINNNTKEATTMFLQHESSGNEVQSKSKVIANGQAAKDKQRKKESKRHVHRKH